MSRLAWLAAAACGAFCALGGTARVEEAVPQRIEAKIPLGDVKGRIDHLAIDLQRLLFVAVRATASEPAAIWVLKPGD